MPDFPEIGYGTVTGRFLAGVLDSPDAEYAPDAEPLQGAVVFSATASVLLVTGAAPPATMFPLPVRVKLDADGNISHQGFIGVSLWATDDPDGNPVNWQWHVHFELTYKGKSVYRAPFNFELPTGSTVDLTVVAPLVVLDDGTVIIRGPEGPAGPGVTDLITAKGDMVAGTGPQAAAIIHVGAEGEYLTPDPAAETGLAWKPLPEGVKAYANLAEAEAVRTSEVGTLWVPSMNAAFYSLSTQWDAFKVTGAAELVITTTVTDSLAVIGTKKYVLQEFHVRAAATEHQEIHRVVRVFEFDTQSGVTTPPTPVWNVLPDLPGYGQGATGQVAVTDPSGKWSSLTAVADNVLIGDANGNWKVGPGGGIKKYADITTAKAVRVAEVGILHVDDLPTAFPELAIEKPDPWGVPGPADLVFTTEIVPYPGTTIYRNIVQKVEATSFGYGLSPAFRVHWEEVTPPFRADTTPFKFAPILPYTDDKGYVAVSATPGSPWVAVKADPTPVAASVMRRDNAGRAQVEDPTIPREIVNKRTLDAAMLAIQAILSGSGVPDDGAGKLGDFYIDTDTDTLYGPKQSAFNGVPEAPILTGVPESFPAATSAMKTFAVTFTVDAESQIAGLRVYLPAGTALGPSFYVWDAAGAQVTSASATPPPEGGWVDVPMPPKPLTPGAEYRAGYYLGSTAPHSYSAAGGFPQSNEHVTLLGAFASNSVFTAPATPDPGNFWVEPLVEVAVNAVWPIAIAPGAPAGSGVKKYADIATAKSVRVAEVGIVHVANVSAAFPELAVKDSASWGYTGPADLIFETFILPYSGNSLYVNVVQEVRSAAVSSKTLSPAMRTFFWEIAAAPGTPDATTFALVATIPSTNVANTVPVSTANKGPYGSVDLMSTIATGPLGQTTTIVRRKIDGSFEAGNPVNPLDVVNKQTMAAAIGAIPATGSVQFEASAPGSTQPGGLWITVPLNPPTVNLGGGVFDSGLSAFIIPATGLYQCLATIRSDAEVEHGLALGVGSASADGPHVVWTKIGNDPNAPGATRSSAQYIRMARFATGDAVRLYTYSDGSPATISSGSLSIIKLAD